MIRFRFCRACMDTVRTRRRCKTSSRSAVSRRPFPLGFPPDAVGIAGGKLCRAAGGTGAPARAAAEHRGIRSAVRRRGTYTARADEPMSEFWTPSDMAPGRLIARAGKWLGRACLWPERSSARRPSPPMMAEKWKQHPALRSSRSAITQFCQGINRFVFHRYAHQPYLDRVPGATMGPWGLHYERTQTWWEMSGAWHRISGPLPVHAAPGTVRCGSLLSASGASESDLFHARIPHRRPVIVMMKSAPRL